MSAAEYDHIDPTVPEEVASLEAVAAADGEVALPQERDEQQQLTFMERCRTAAQMAIVAAEVSPANEVARYSLLATTAAVTGKPLTAAIAYGVSTVAIEGVAAVAAAPVLDTKTGSKITQKISSGLDGLGVKEGVTSNTAVKAGVAIWGGSALSMGLKKIDEPTITRLENRKYGLKITAALGAICTAEGVLIAEGIAHPSLEKIGVATMAVGGMVGIAKILKNRIARRYKNVEQAEQTEAVKPRYDLSREELAELEHGLLEKADEALDQPGIAAVWIDPKSPYANFVRTHEASYFPEVAEVSEEADETTRFLALVDTREGSRRVVHGATVMVPKTVEGENGELELVDDESGMYTIDSLIERGNFTLEEFKDYYAAKGIDLMKTLSVETNFRIGEKPELYNGLKTADLTYVAIFQMLETMSPEMNKAMMLATINKKQVASFDRFGVGYEPLMGRRDLNTEESELGIESLPIAMLYDERYAAMLSSGALKMPAVKV